MICSLRSSFYRFFTSGFLKRTVILSFLTGIFMYMFILTSEIGLGILLRPRSLDIRIMLFGIEALLYTVPFWVAIFVMRFTGNDLSMRTVNNKIATGLPRWCVYLSDLIVTAFAIMIFIFICVTILFLIGRFLPYRSTVTMTRDLLMLTLRLTAISVAFAAVFMFLQYFLSTRLFGLIIALLILPSIMSINSNVGLVLDEPYRYSYTDEATGEQMWEINPDYIGGTKRMILTYVYEINPFRESFLQDKKMPSKDMTAAVMITAASTAAGLIAVSRKEFN